MAATPASMLRIVTSGLQDRERLNIPFGNPSTDFYTSVIRKRTRWASQWRRVDFDNLADFGRKATVTLPILGDLISRAVLVVELPDIYGPQQKAEAAAKRLREASTVIGPKWSWTNGTGNALCSEMEFSIGNAPIDRLDSRLLEVLDEQHGPVEHFDSTNVLLGRDPTGYTQSASQGLRIFKDPQRLYIVPPFWWNRGPGPQVLPIQALAKDKVQITVNFRDVQDCVYTDGRVTAQNPPMSGNSGPGPLPVFPGCGFYITWPTDEGGVPIYDMTREPFLLFGGGELGGEFNRRYVEDGKVLPGVTMPTEWHFADAYWMVEYITLEERESAAYRMGDLQIPIEQHVAVPVVQTAGAPQVRIPLNQGGLVRDMMWVAQRAEAPSYNAYFLFSRDLGPPDASGSFLPWWPNALIPNWDFGDGYLRPAFVDRKSDPISAATLWTRGVRRFENEAPSFFRSLMPLLNCQRTALIDRYVYRYDFGFWPTGGLAETLDMPVDEVRGFSNWDLIPNKELALTFNQDDCEGRSEWEAAGETRVYDISSDRFDGVFTRFFETDFPLATEAFRIELQGGQPADFGGRGAIVRGIVDYKQLRRTFGSNLQTIVRLTSAGSASLIVQKPVGLNFEYTWIAVAGGGGVGTEFANGGDAGNAVKIGFRADGVRTHDATDVLGGAGGGRLAEAGVGLPDGGSVVSNQLWIFTGGRTGGDSNAVQGGDGYKGGGSGADAGGGGGSYVSRYITGVETLDYGEPQLYPPEYNGKATVRITPLKAVRKPKPSYDVYVWLTTYNLLRIAGGRGALMFSA